MTESITQQGPEATQETLGNVLITGGASGLGAAVAEAVRAAGGTPLVIDQVAPHPDIVHFIQADIGDSEAAESAVDALAERAGGIDAVFTAAGVDSCGPLHKVPRKEWERVIHVNLLGTVSVVRAALPYLERNAGRVVTCASTLGLRAVSDATAYCASKFAVVGFTRALAAETAGRVGVTLLVPGGMETAFFDGRDEQYKPPPDAMLNKPADVAKAVLFALRQPPGCEVRELLVCSSTEGSWP
ncbi:SDR family oxidoreductase [Hoyosella sp. YIM 151337]|uniref:SDR family oxidoreductase n=1 Tax=Hoyosella sp. YIM 151337 TaxID=2992742 RepID=UPI002236614A|nr:SDR family oxidoreductase [Hoyosella sp. YIM 151337]MCW4355506.1 SDR family oxidoreductase [Hoyosella sp. YIM 151337]